MFNNMLLEKPYNVIEKLISYLYHHNGTETKETICHVLNITPATLTDYIHSLNQLLYEENLDDSLHISFEKDRLFLHKDTTFSLKMTHTLFLMKSIKYQMLCQLFSSGELSADVFQHHWEISPATYYRRIAELNQLLKDFDLQIKRGKISGHENQIRYFYFSFFWFVYEDKQQFEEDTRHHYSSLIHSLKETLHLQIKPKEEFKLKLWMYIAMTRWKKSQHSQLSNTYLRKERPLFQEVDAVYQAYLSKHDRSCTPIESAMFYDFLCGQMIFSMDSIFTQRLILEHQYQQTRIYNQQEQFFTYLKKQNIFQRFSDTDELIKSTDLLFQLHAQFYYFKGVILTIDDYFLESWLEHLKIQFPITYLQDLVHYCQTRIPLYDPKDEHAATLTQLNYAIILHTLLDTVLKNKLTIMVYHPTDSLLERMVIQIVTKAFDHLFDLNVISYQINQPCDLLLTNHFTSLSTALDCETYVYSDGCTEYDLVKIKRMIQQLSLQKQVQAYSQSI